MVEADDDVAAPTSTATVFPVVLFDGERETDVGNITIHPDLVFKQFQTMLSQMIGISYNNLTTYLVDSSKSKISPDRRRFLITGKVNFSVIVRETNCYFLVVLKRSRRDRRRRPVKQIDYFYNDRFHDYSDLLFDKGNYMNMILNSGYGFGYSPNIPSIEDAYPRARVRAQNSPNKSLCEECRVAEKHGKIAEFHLCVYDEVVVGGFRSPVGPVSRPL